MARAKAPVAIVTGAANGIDRAIAQRLLDDGWCVGVLDLPGSGLKRRYGGHLRHVVLIEGDVAEEETALGSMRSCPTQASWCASPYAGSRLPNGIRSWTPI